MQSKVSSAEAGCTISFIGIVLIETKSAVQLEQSTCSLSVICCRSHLLHLSRSLWVQMGSLQVNCNSWSDIISNLLRALIGSAPLLLRLLLGLALLHGANIQGHHSRPLEYTNGIKSHWQKTKQNTCYLTNKSCKSVRTRHSWVSILICVFVVFQKCGKDKPASSIQLPLRMQIKEAHKHTQAKNK